MVLAGPGSGKTTVITHRIRRLIGAGGVDPASILVITFTKAAALQMQERFFRLMEGQCPPVVFGTFHAVFFKILKYAYLPFLFGMYIYHSTRPISQHNI